MSKQFTIITKNGSKWLRPIKSATMPPHWGLNMPSLPYLGNHPEGTVLDESEVIEVRQWRRTDVTDCSWKVATCDFEIDHAHQYFETHAVRTAYVDVEPSHDRHIRPFKTHNVRPLVNQLVGEEISFSRFIELLNEIANTH